ncbi:MAG TPA: nuclear transport factor 2 family protein [Microlunatus sp.]
MTHADTVRSYWAAAEARDWERFASLLAPDVVYTLEQSRERIRGVDRYVAFNRDYPGDWHVTLVRVVADDEAAFSWARVAVGGDEQVGLTVFAFDADGSIAAIDDFWPAPSGPLAGREHLVERF